MQLLIAAEDGTVTSIEMDQVCAAFAGLIDQFDRDPLAGVDLIDAASPDVTAQIIGAGWGGTVCGAMASATAKILRRYPDQPADSIVGHLDIDLVRLGIDLESEFSSEAIATAKGIVQSALMSDADNQDVLAALFAVQPIDDPMTVVQVMKVTMTLCCTAVAVAQGY